MSILLQYLAVEKPLDGKPFTVCEVNTWFNLEVAMLETERKVKNAAKQLFNAFHIGNDKTEIGATLEEILELKSNGKVYIIPKTKDAFIPARDWGKQ